VASGKNLHARTLEAQNLRCDRDELQSALRREREEHEAAKLELVRRNDVYHNPSGHGSHSERSSSQSEVVVLASKMADERLAVVERDAMERTRTLLEELEDAVLHKGQFERAALILEEQVRNSRDEGRVARERLAEATREAERLAARQRDAAYKAVNRMQRLALYRAMSQWRERPARMAHARAAANTVIKRWVNQSLAFGLSGWSSAVQVLVEARDSADAMAKSADRRLLIESVAEWHANVRAVKVMGRAFGTVSGRKERTLKRCCVAAWSLLANGERRRARNGELVQGRVATSTLRVALLSWASTAVKAKRTRGILRRFFGKQLHQNLVVAFEAFASVGREGRERRLHQAVQEKAELQVMNIFEPLLPMWLKEREQNACLLVHHPETRTLTSTWPTDCWYHAAGKRVDRGSRKAQEASPRGRLRRCRACCSAPALLDGFQVDCYVGGVDERGQENSDDTSPMHASNEAQDDGPRTDLLECYCDEEEACQEQGQGGAGALVCERSWVCFARGEEKIQEMCHIFPECFFD